MTCSSFTSSRGLRTTHKHHRFRSCLSAWYLFLCLLLFFSLSFSALCRSFFVPLLSRAFSSSLPISSFFERVRLLSDKVTHQTFHADMEPVYPIPRQRQDRVQSQRCFSSLSLSRPKAEAKGKKRKLYFTSSLLIHARSQDWMIPLKPYNISMHEQKRISRRTGVRREEREEEKGGEKELSLSLAHSIRSLSILFSHTRTFSYPLYLLVRKVTALSKR